MTLRLPANTLSLIIARPIDATNIHLVNNADCSSQNGLQMVEQNKLPLGNIEYILFYPLKS